jgi:hypothetical protein
MNTGTWDMNTVTERRCLKYAFWTYGSADVNFTVLHPKLKDDNEAFISTEADSKNSDKN